MQKTGRFDVYVGDCQNCGEPILVHPSDREGWKWTRHVVCREDYVEGICPFPDEWVDPE